MEKSEVETSMHFILPYSAFARLGLQHLGSHTFRKPEDLAETELGRLDKIVSGCTRFFYL